MMDIIQALRSGKISQEEAWKLSSEQSKINEISQDWIEGFRCRDSGCHGQLFWSHQAMRLGKVVVENECPECGMAFV